MKIIVTKILSLNADGACCYLLNLGNQVKILFDCGISNDFNFNQYIKFKSEILSVNLILISHSSIQYSGALPFLITQFGIDPKIVYTTQPVMRYAPLNLHQQILTLRIPNYNQKVFNKIYSFFQTIQVIKPYQKKVLSIQSKNQSQSLLKGSSKNIHFSSYQAGGTLSSLCWKIRMGLINIVYLVDYNNFSLNHINGLDLQAIKNQSVNLLMTDMCPAIGDQKIKKQKLYIQMKKILIDFYTRQGIDPSRPKAFLNNDIQKKILFTCYPSEMLIQIMITLRKVISDLQQPTMRQKIVVIHLSSRYLQLIKSQVQNFSQQTKPFIDKIDEFFIHSRSLTCRINVSSYNQINGILNKSLCSNNNIQIYNFGQEMIPSKIVHNLQTGKQNIKTMKLFIGQQQQISIISNENKQFQNSLKKIEQNLFNPMLQQSKQQMKQQEIIRKIQKLQDQIQVKQQLIQNQNQISKQPLDNINLKIQRSFSQLLKQQKQNLNPFNQNNLLLTNQKPKSLVGKYLSQISFPHFVKSHQQQDFDFNDYGLKHHLQPSTRPHKRTINDIMYNHNQSQLQQPNLITKKSTVQVMNIEFGIQNQFKFIDVNSKGRMIQNYANKTNFSSSLKIIQILNPKNTFILNSSSDQTSQKLFKLYKSNLKNQLYNLATTPKNQCIIQIQNQLVEYKVNYLPLGQNPLHKIKGKVQSINGIIHLHIQILQQKQILQFRIQKFYKQCKNLFGKNLCKFTGNGIMISGIKIYREGTQIILEGSYSQSYFKVRKALYQFLQIR